MIRKYTINSRSWTAITSAGQSGICWIEKNIRGNGLININHSDSGNTNNAGFRLKKPLANNDICIISPDNDNDIYYARVLNSKNIVKIVVDVA